MVGHYSILRVSTTATIPEIKTAYRKLALTLHPDVNGGCENKTKAFKSATEAYDVLSNEDLRREYDSTLGVGGYGSYQSFHHSNSRRRTTTSRRSKVYAPSQPPPGPGGRVYDFEAWNMGHYGDRGVFTDGDIGGAASASRTHSRKYIHDRDEIVLRMQQRRMERRAGNAPAPQSLCSIQ